MPARSPQTTARREVMEPDGYYGENDEIGDELDLSFLD